LLPFTAAAGVGAGANVVAGTGVNTGIKCGIDSMNTGIGSWTGSGAPTITMCTASAKVIFILSLVSLMTR